MSRNTSNDKNKEFGEILPLLAEWLTLGRSLGESAIFCESTAFVGLG